MMTQLKASDGHEFECWMEEAKGERKGGLVILQEIFGVTDQLKGLAERYAARGYDVAVPALFDRQKRAAVISFDNGTPGRELMLAADLDQTMMDIKAAIEALAAKGNKVAVMGFCWGGGLAIRAAQLFDIGGAIAFYGTRLPQYLDRPLKAPVIGHYGTKDEHVPAETLDQAMAYFPEMKVYKYETGHAFANDARPGLYDETSAEIAHQRTEAFLEKHLS